MNNQVRPIWAMMGVLLFATGGMVVNAETIQQAYFAGGCFWCMEPPFERIDGVQAVISGYTGGAEKHPTYKEVVSGRTGHYEAVKVIYDAEKVSYDTLLNIFWRQVDPTDGGGQFIDRGKQYRTAIFYADEDQKKQALASKAWLEEAHWFSRPIITEILPFTAFYEAEDYHQDYYKTSPYRYKFYRTGSGRDQFLKKTWGAEADDSDAIPKRK